MPAFELPRLYHPDFATPGSYPAGDVEVDWENPITEGLVICLLPGKYGGKNLAAIGNSDTGSPTVSKGADTKGPFLKKTDQGDQGWDFVNPSTGSSNRTFLTGQRRVNNLTSGSFVSAGTNSTGERWTVRSSSNSLRVEIQGSGYTSSLSINDQEYAVLGCVLDGSTLADHKLFYNKTFESASGTNSVNTTGATYSVYGDPFGTALEGVDSNHYFTYHFTRALSETEIKSLTDDPYQVLKPRTAQIYSFPSGAAPSGRIMGGLAGLGGLAGRGGLAGTGGGMAG